MGYRRKDKRQRYKLVFADEDMRGLEIIVTKLPLGMVLRIRELSALGLLADPDPETYRQLIVDLMPSMLSWNMEDDLGAPIPLTVESLLAEDESFVKRIYSEWTLALAGVSAPLDDGSTSGEPALEASIPMETLSPNPLS